MSVAFECAAFDAKLTRGGLSTLVWHLSREYVRQGHKASVVTPAHGQIDYLRARYGLVELDYRDDHIVPLVLDPRVWRDQPHEVDRALSTRAFLLSHESVDIYFLSDAYLDLLPDKLYPDWEYEGCDLAFFKPLAFQLTSIRFIDSFFGNQSLTVQAYEPYYSYILPPVFAGRADRIVMSTIPVNIRIEEKVYRPQIERVFAVLGASVDLDSFKDSECHGELASAIAAYRRPAHRTYDYGTDYICHFSLVAAFSDLIDFLSPGQRDHYSTFRDTPFEELFEQLTVARVIRDNAHKQIVGGCALPQWWLDLDPKAVDRARVLESLNLDPRWPTFFHAARFALSHKGQLELMRAVDQVLAADREVNFVIRCAMGAASDAWQGVGHTYIQDVANRYPHNVHLDWRMVDERVLFEHAAAADFCIFPSKNETDAFLIVQGEAMACGAVPIATAQEVTRHFGHGLPLSHPDATGLSVMRSFRRDDPRLTAELTDRIRQALTLFRSEPKTYARLSANAQRVARTFVWERCAKTRIEACASVAVNGLTPLSPEVAVQYGWFDRLSDTDWKGFRQAILVKAEQLGDLDAYRRCGILDADAVARLFAASFRRGDFQRCRRLAALGSPQLEGVLDGRCRMRPSGNLWRIEYRLPTAVSVDLFGSGSVSQGPQGLVNLRGRDGVFSGHVPYPADQTSLIFIITLDSGRVTWDQVRIADVIRTHEGKPLLAPSDMIG